MIDIVGDLLDVLDPTCCLDGCPCLHRERGESFARYVGRCCATALFWAAVCGVLVGVAVAIGLAIDGSWLGAGLSAASSLVLVAVAWWLARVVARVNPGVVRRARRDAALQRRQSRASGDH